MKIPKDFEGKVCKLQYAFNFRDVEKYLEDWPNAYGDVIYENENGNIKPIIVIVFESTEDCLAFKLKHGNKCL
jgi:hypothetical protein